MATSVQIVVDCADPAGLAQFWATALGYKPQDPPEGYASWPDWLRAQGIPEDQWNSASAVVDPTGQGPRLYFQRVNVGGGPGTPLEERRKRVDAEAERLTAAGAVRLGEIEERGEYCVNMQDPEGNEFDLQ